MKSIHRNIRFPARQRGQALIYGIVILFGALAATFFLFNTGQLSAEKTKLVNTADAVAYSAGVMHARALNFDAYTNRALLANETTVAQLVSVSSWLEYSKEHSERVFPLLCNTYYSIPIVTATLKYEPLCFLLAYGGATAAISSIESFYNAGAVGFMGLAEASKVALQAAQFTMYADMLIARNQTLSDVANANYRDDGTISVDTIPLTDNWTLFEGRPFIDRRAGDERARFRALEVGIINKDEFVRNRSWSSQSIWPCILLPVGRAAHNGGTVLQGYDTWRADDNAAFTLRKWRFRLFSSGCRQIAKYNLGDSTKTAGNSGNDFYYSGVPNFYELSEAALGYVPENSDAAKRDPHLQFAIRLTRDKAQQKTSAGRSEVKPSGRLDLYPANQASNKMAAVATSEVYFDRAHTPREGGGKELASLFNPFWQVHLVPNSTAVSAAALVLQGAGN